MIDQHLSWDVGTMERECQRATSQVGIPEFELEDKLKKENGSNVMYIVI